ncbi:manganese efflux pump MntP family protein [Bacillaceae bacterium]
MAFDLVEWGQWLTLFMIATALGMDAFSLGIGIGMAGIRLRHVVKISMTIGLFHILMPLIGIFVGMYLTSFIGDIATYVGGLILILLGSHMLWDSLVGEEATAARAGRATGWGLLLFAFSVSLDALSVGFSFGLIDTDIVLAVSMFGVMGTVMAGSGLILGRRMGDWVGDYGEALGGLILLAFGIKFLL